MKNFYDQQATNLSIGVILSPIIDKDCPDIILKINATVLHEGVLTEKMSFIYEWPLMDIFKISLELKNKNYKSSCNTAVSIDSLKIDDFDIVPNWTQLATYFNDSKITAPTNYLGFNGTWSLEITEPFYRWQHKVTGQGWLLQP